MGKKTQPEQLIVKAIIEYLHIKGVFCWVNKTQGQYDPVRRCFRTFHGLKGVSDILGVLPNGQFLAIEVKTKTGKISPEQRDFIQKVNDLQGFAFVARSVEDVQAKFASKDEMFNCPAVKDIE